MAALTNLSSDVFWEIVRPSNKFLVKSKKNGGVQFSSDPLNLTNCHSRKYAGFINDKAVGVVPGEKDAVVLLSKKVSAANKPAENLIKTTIGGGKTSRKVYKAVATQTAKHGYRPDLRAAAVERASAIKQSQRPVKAEPEPKLRGKKAKKAAEESA
ncbi:putative 60S ribosomal protein L28e [Escovopsis weberi]|uniref:Putative 60S ribosomal protein L28e n=1 Tax=Escovopsis weberi TaxID=150374 RepID=A0A0M8MZK2_ESCWE|nr:putative 60S ribosomal protein L28e [Escovopsis weberi]